MSTIVSLMIAVAFIITWVIVGFTIKVLDYLFDEKISEKITNFKRGEIISQDSGIFKKTTEYATVDRITGFVFKKTTKLKIFKDSMFWKYLDGGEYCHKADELDKAEAAKSLMIKANK